MSSDSTSFPEAESGELRFPESPRVRFSRNPLVEVVCQFRFNPILRISQEPPADFQERIRQEYPEYTREPDRLGAPDDIPEEVLETLARHLRKARNPVHRFATESEQPRTILLSQSFLSVSETGYTDWESFVAATRRVEEVFADIYRPGPYVRLGLRYINKIVPAALGLDACPWSELIRPEFAGVTGTSYVSPFLKESSARALVVVPQVPDGGVLLQHGVQHDEDGSFYFIDSDFFTSSRRNSSDARELLALFNRLAGNLFRSALQERLVRALGPTPLDRIDRTVDAEAYGGDQ